MSESSSDISIKLACRCHGHKIKLSALKSRLTPLTYPHLGGATHMYICDRCRNERLIRLTSRQAELLTSAALPDLAMLDQPQSEVRSSLIRRLIPHFSSQLGSR